MAEIIGATKGIKTLIELTSEVIDYIKDVRGADDERSKLLGEIVGTRNVLSDLLSKANEVEWKTTMDLMNAPHGPLDQFKSVLEHLHSELKPAEGKLAKVGKAMTWHFTKPKMNKMLTQLLNV